MNLSAPPKDNEPIRVTLQQIGLASFVKWQTLAFFILGIFTGMVYAGWFAVTRLITGRVMGRAVVWQFLLTSVSYAVIGFLSSAILGVLYNSLASRFGGMRFDIVTHNNPVPPPPPECREGSLPKINDRETPERA